MYSSVRVLALVEGRSSDRMAIAAPDMYLRMHFVDGGLGKDNAAAVVTMTDDWNTHFAQVAVEPEDLVAGYSCSTVDPEMESLGHCDYCNCLDLG